MQQVTEQQILALAPNPAAASNGRKISQKGGFVRLEKSADDTFYLGECTGSGKSNYITTADYIDPKAPVFRCSCPSRQFPCKHSLALLYEMMAGKSFTVCEIPEDILKTVPRREGTGKRAGRGGREPVNGTDGKEESGICQGRQGGQGQKNQKAAGGTCAHGQTFKGAFAGRTRHNGRDSP